MRHYPEYTISDSRCAPIPEGHQLKINAFIDHSSLEVFINDGELNFVVESTPSK